MTDTIFSHNILLNSLSTIVASIVLMLLYFIISAALTRKEHDLKEKHRTRVRLLYIMSLVFIFFLTQIWVEGFTQLLTVLGLVAAALVITNKESIMNFTGWLIIVWRGLFSEEDLIEIQHYTGYVKSIRVLYFTLLEVDKNFQNVITGRIIRIPNSLVVTNPVINFSPAYLIEQQLPIILDRSSDIILAKKKIKEIVDQVIEHFYQHKKEYTRSYLEQRSQKIAARIHLNSMVIIRPRYELPSGMLLTARYYCFAKDAEAIEQEIWAKLLKFLATAENIRLVG